MTEGGGLSLPLKQKPLKRDADQYKKEKKHVDKTFIQPYPSRTRKDLWWRRETRLCISLD
jgi:hypothetical protein